MTNVPRFPDFSRHSGLLDHQLLTGSHVAVIGVGGAAGLANLLVRSGVGKLTLVDPDIVSATNPTTQNHDYTDLGRPKVEALATRLTDIDPSIIVETYHGTYESLPAAAHPSVWQSDMVLAMTDRFATQAAINRQALETHTDAVFAISYPDAVGVEITATFAEAVAAGSGCHRCHTKSRYDDYASGYQNPAVIGSHAVIAEYLNTLIALIVIGRLHQRAASDVAIGRVAEVFARTPCLISRLDPLFYAAPGEPFSDAPREMSLFTTKLWALDTPDTWICPDCGTAGRVPQMRGEEPRSPPCPNRKEDRMKPTLLPRGPVVTGGLR
ncbi:UBA/THIF-type NAD/FAD binding protein [Hyphomicrobium denitrificans 1NES1]|uniref:UBA/THIF-type NAD/FAD binding protein n=1 Tax=Hyphomicrobium denitrificans 1NES1 TaxID=670307 RepID=N0B941_9HYPH|nr:ThiF family adenylyltransferase [Hyphomicrobium denitrificans]AGK57031.1 UBA/THIF-type NAD/FAD binding protein [Hyphomicrobium denitrificans 1NES1]